MVSTDIQLTEEQAHRLEQLAGQAEVSTGDLVRRAIDYWLQTTQSVDPNVSEVQRQRARAAAGAFRSGLTNLSEQHDEYLADMYGDFDA